MSVETRCITYTQSMKILKLLSVAGLAATLSATANAQFSISGGGSTIPASGTGGGGTWDTVMPPNPATSTVTVPEAVTRIDCITIDGLAHTWIGDLQATLKDPNGVEHNIFVRPGYLNTSNFGNSGDFDGGSYTFVPVDGSDLPNDDLSVNPPAGCYNQDFDTGGTTWVSGTSGINNTDVAVISGPAGTWTLTIYDWGAGDSGSFTGWTLSANAYWDCNGCAPNIYNQGISWCDCFWGNSPCFNSSGAGRGCPNSNANGLGAALVGHGHASTSFGFDTFSLSVTDAAPNKPGLILAGTDSQGLLGVATVPDSAGLLCVGGVTRRGDVVLTDANGAASFPDFQGAPYGQSDLVLVFNSQVAYTFWFRDPGTAAGCNNDTASSDFNFSNGWLVTWN